MVIENLLYSLNATLPIFFMILIGYLLAQRKVLNENFVNVANGLVFNMALPALLFKDLSSIPIREIFDLRYVAFCFIVTSVCFFSIWAGAEIFIKDKKKIGAFVQASFRSSAAVLGIAFIQNIYGEIGFAPLMIIGTVPIYNIYSVIVLTFRGGEKKAEGLLRKAFLRILTNPMLISIFVGLLAAFFELKFPRMMDQTISQLASIATPLALLAIGAGFSKTEAFNGFKLAIISSSIKLILQPAIFLPLAIAFGYQGQQMIAILVMLGAPATASCYIMAKNMHNDEKLTSSIIVLTTLLASVTLTFWIYILKMLQVL